MHKRLALALSLAFTLSAQNIGKFVISEEDPDQERNLGRRRGKDHASLRRLGDQKQSSRERLHPEPDRPDRSRAPHGWPGSDQHRDRAAQSSERTLHARLHPRPRESGSEQRVAATALGQASRISGFRRVADHRGRTDDRSDRCRRRKPRRGLCLPGAHDGHRPSTAASSPASRAREVTWGRPPACGGLRPPLPIRPSEKPPQAKVCIRSRTLRCISDALSALQPPE